MTNYSLGPLEQEVMNCVWEHKEKTVRGVYDRLARKRSIAYTTVMTIMTRLVDKQFLTRKKVGKAYIYSPAKTKKQITKSMIGSIFDSLVDQFGEEAIVAFSDEVDKASGENK